jgi:hypothetical protein
MKPEQRIKALAAFINREDKKQGRPKGFPLRTPASLEAKVTSYGLVTAYVDNHCPREDFAVLTMDEATTSKLLPGDRDYGRSDCVTVDGETFLVVYLG